MALKGNEVKVGLMIVATIIILGLFLAAIFGLKFISETKSYEVRFDYVGGIKSGTLVKYGGMDVGQVTEVSLPDSDNTRISLNIEVDAETPIRVNSTAYVSSVGIMTEKHIEISPGSPDSDLLPPGSVLDSKEVPSIMQIAESFGDLNSQIEKLLSRINDIFADDQKNNFASVMQNLNNLIEQLQKSSAKASDDFEVLTTELIELTNNFNAFIDDNQGNLTNALQNIEEATKETNLLISEVRGTLENLRIMTSSNNQGLMELMENLQTTSQNMEEFSRMIKEQPWLLVRKAAPPERKIP